MRWPWPPKQTLTPEQQEHTREIASAWKRAWDTDWGATLDAMCRSTGLNRTEAMLFVLCMRAEYLPIMEQRTPDPHEGFRSDCTHCVEQKRVLDIQTRYMEEAIKFMQREQSEGDEWKPIA